MSLTDSDKDSEKAPEQIQEEIERTRSDMTSKWSALEQKLSPRQVASDLFDMARERIIGSGNGTSHMIEMIKQNPIPVALIGIGLGWMVFSGRSTGRARYAEPRSPYAGSAAGTYANAGRRGRETGRGTGGIVDKVSDRAGTLSREVSERASAITQGVSEKAHDYYDQARDQASGYYSQAKDRATGYYGQARDIAGATYSRVEGTMQNNPLLVGGVGLAIGAAIGAVLPMTAQEQEYLGEARDQLLQQAGEYGHEAMARAREAAEAAGRAAYEEAGRHFSGEGQALQGQDSGSTQAKQSHGMESGQAGASRQSSTATTIAGPNAEGSSSISGTGTGMGSKRTPSA